MQLDATTIIWIVVAITGILGLAFALSKKKKVMEKSKWIFAVPLLVATIGLGAWQLGYLDSYITPSMPIEPSTPLSLGIQGSGSGACPVEGFTRIDGICQCIGTEDTTVTLSAIDKYTQAATSGSHRYSRNGAAAKTVSDGGTFTASPGDSLKVLFTNASTSSTYLGKLVETVVPCKGTFDVSEELVGNGTITLTVYNEDGDAIGPTKNETLAAGDVVTLDAKIKHTFQKGAPYGAVMVVEMNTTDFDDVEADFGGSEVEVPQIYTRQYGTASKTRAFSIPAFESTDVLTGVVVLDADDTNGPEAIDANQVHIEILLNNYFVNEDKGGAIELGVEDEDDVKTHNHRTTYTLYVA